MAEYRRFTFDTDFTPEKHKRKPAEEVVPEEEEEGEDFEEVPPPPTFSEEELQAAKDEAFQEGRAEGFRQAETTTQQMIANALNIIAAGMPSLRDAQDQANDDTARTALQVALNALGRVLPTFVARHGAGEIETMVAELMPHLLDQPRIIVKVHHDLVEGLRDRLVAVTDANGFEGRVVVMGDAAIMPGDCRLEWADGGAERDMARVWQEIEDIIDRHVKAIEAEDGDFQTVAIEPDVEPPAAADAAPADPPGNDASAAGEEPPPETQGVSNG